MRLLASLVAVALLLPGCAYLRGVGGPRVFDEPTDETADAPEGDVEEFVALRVPLVERWSFELPDLGVWAAARHEKGRPTVDGDRILVGSGRAPGLYALDRATGALHQTITTLNPVQSAPLLLDGRILVTDAGGYIYLFDGDGNPLWQVHSGGPIYTQPVVDGDLVLVGTTTDVLIALDLVTGAFRWTFRPDETLVRSELSILGSSRPVVHDDQVYLGMSDGTLVCLERHNGVLQWTMDIGEGRFIDVDSAPVITEDGLLVIGSYSGPTVGVDLEGRSLVWRSEAGVSGDILLHYGRLYFVDESGTLHCLAPEDGTEHWTYVTGRKRDLMNSPVASGRVLMIALSDGTLLALDAFAGELLWRNEPREFYLSAAVPPTIAGREVFFVTGDGMVRSLAGPPGVYDTLEDEPAHRASRELNW